MSVHSCCAEFGAAIGGARALAGPRQGTGPRSTGLVRAACREHGRTRPTGLDEHSAGVSPEHDPVDIEFADQAAEQSLELGQPFARRSRYRVQLRGERRESWRETFVVLPGEQVDAQASRRIAVDAHQLADSPLLLPPDHQPSGRGLCRIRPVDAVDREEPADVPQGVCDSLRTGIPLEPQPIESSVQDLRPAEQLSELKVRAQQRRPLIPARRSRRRDGRPAATVADQRDGW